MPDSPLGQSGRPFHLGDILSITTGRLVAPDGIDGVYRICDYMLDTSHFTHQLPRASDECKAHLLAQHPQLVEAEPPARFEDEAHVWRWLAEQTDRYGVELPVSPVREPVDRDPIEELIEMRGGADGIIVVDAPEGADDA